MTASVSDLVFVGTHGHVRAVDKASGQDRWTTSLPGAGYQLVTLLVEDGVLFAGSNGLLFALDPVSGAIRWQNGLTGLGHGHMMLATMRADLAQMLVAAVAESDMHAAAAASAAT